MQPRHNPNAASRNAAAVSISTATREATGMSAMYSMHAAAENSKPTSCAKRFGGPGTMRWVFLMRGVRTRVAKSASGLNAGPVLTLARNP